MGRLVDEILVPSLVRDIVDIYVISNYDATVKAKEILNTLCEGKEWINQAETMEAAREKCREVFSSTEIRKLEPCKTTTNYNLNWKNNNVETPQKMIDFLNEIHEVCKKYNLSLSHEDGHGSFIVQEYDRHNIRWLFSAGMEY